MPVHRDIPPLAARRLATRTPAVPPHARRPGAAFTLIELMVVIAIIIILAAIVIAVGVGVKNSAQRRSTVAELHSLQGIMQDYLRDHPEPDTTPGQVMPTFAGPARDLSSWPTEYSDPDKLAGRPAPAFAETKVGGSGGNANTHPSSDPVNWVALLRADPTTAKSLESLKTGTDPFGNVTILDAFGTPIRYVPYNMDGNKHEGYFQSAGADRTFVNTDTSSWSSQPSTPFPADDIYSTDTQ